MILINIYLVRNILDGQNKGIDIMLKKLFYIMHVIVIISLLYFLLQPNIVNQPRFHNYVMVVTMVQVISAIILIAYRFDKAVLKDQNYIFNWYIFIFTTALILLTNQIYPTVQNISLLDKIVNIFLLIVVIFYVHKLWMVMIALNIKFENILKQWILAIELKYGFKKIKLNKWRSK